MTLLELLVVIGGLSLLAGLLLPVVTAARQRAWSATCTSHLRQLALAFRLYCDDYEDTFPANHRGQITALADLDGLWIGQIRPYLQTDAVFHCPADPIRNARRTLSDGLPEEWDRPGLPKLSYGANWDLLAAAAADRPQARVGSLPYPAQTLMVADCSEPWAHGPVYTQQGVRWSHIAYANGPPVSGLANWVYHGGRDGSGHERHREGSHVAFLDGHVAFLPATRFYSATRFEAIGPVEIQRPIVWPEAVPPEE
jgi:prepilin-type processing-associated H-X9-DG protein